jgi:hypothetical protein
MTPSEEIPASCSVTKTITPRKFKEYGDEFQAKMGAEGIKDLLQSIDIDGSIEKLRNDPSGSEHQDQEEHQAL